MATEYKFDDDLPITDISGLGSFDFGPMSKPEAVVIHHTGGRGTAEDVMNVFNQRNFPAQFIMDRDGNVFRALPEGMKGQHIRPSQINNLSNSNTLGIEIIAKDDNDLTPAQREASTRWLNFVGNKYGIPAANVFGHGEINRHKQATEGSTVVNDWRGSNRVAQPDLGPPAAGDDLPMGQRTLMAYAGRDVPRKPASPFEAEYAAASKETGIPVEVLRAKDAQESRFNPNLIGRSGEIGIGQVKPSTAADPGFGVEPIDPARLKNPADNIMFGARYLAARAKAAGVTDWSNPDSIAKGLTAYNGGGDPNYAANVMRYINNPGSLPVPDGSVPRLNPSLTAAAERGRGPAADRPARGSAYVEANVPAMAPQPQIDPMRNETGLQGRQLQVAAEEQRQGQAPTPTGQAVGGLGGLGGFVIPGTNTVVPASGKTPSSVESLLPFNKPNPFAFFGEAARENQEAELKHKGQVFAANQLVAQGMSPEQAVATVYSPHIGQQLALSGVKQQRDAVVNADVAGRLGMTAPISPPGIAGQSSTPPVSSAAGAGGSPSAPKPMQPQAVPSAATGSPSATSAPATDAQARISTGNKTVDALFTLREQKLREYRQTSDLTARAASSPAAEAAVKARLDAIKTEIGGIDEQMKQYAPTGTIKEYVYAMNQRREQGLPVISMEQFDQEQRRAGAANVNVGGGSDAQIFTAMEKGAEAAQTAANGLQSIREARRAVAGGGFFGSGADWKLGLQKAAAGLGIGDPESLSKIVNTETFRSAIAPQVAATMKATVGSTQISNADREFAEKAAGGSITLDEKSIVRLLDIMERAGTDIVQRHQKKLDTVYPESAGKFARERALFGVAVSAAPTEAPQGQTAQPPAAHVQPAPATPPSRPAAQPQPRPSGPVTITNPTTGQRMMLTPNGTWAPIDG